MPTASCLLDYRPGAAGRSASAFTARTATRCASGAAIAPSDRPRRAIAPSGKAGEGGDGALGVSSVALRASRGRVRLGKGSQLTELDVTV